MFDKTEIVMMYARSLNFQPEGKDPVTGLQVYYYIPGPDGKKFAPQGAGGIDQGVGVQCSKGFLPLNDKSKIVTVPGIYDANIELTTNSKGKNELRLADIEFKNDFDLRPLLSEAM